MNHLSTLRVLAWAIFLIDLTESTLIIKIEEIHFNRNCKSKYSWGLYWVDKEYQNENLANFINMIQAQCSIGS